MVFNQLMFLNQNPEPEPTENPYLTFSSASSFTLGVRNVGWDGSIEYSTNAEEWSTWNGSTITSALSDTLYYIYLRGSNNTVISGDSWRTYFSMGGSSEVNCSGNIENLLDYETVASGLHPTMSACCFYDLFTGCSMLATPPELPATTLSYGCYWQMFDGCTHLTKLPKLPATELKTNCYLYMFQGCTSIKLSETQTEVYTYEYRIPTSETGTAGSASLLDMFANTGGTFTGTPTINTTYYTDHEPI